MDMEKQLEIIDLNDRALTGMTYITLPYMPDGAQIYNMGSMSSFQPVPYINVYGASKAYVLSFSKALRVELCRRNIRVMAVCPGWIKPEYFSPANPQETVRYCSCRAYQAYPYSGDGRWAGISSCSRPPQAEWTRYGRSG